MAGDGRLLAAKIDREDVSIMQATPATWQMLIDTGWPGYEGRDADRILAAAHQAGLKQIDYVLITHYHRDHVGGVPQLVDGIKVGTHFLEFGAEAFYVSIHGALQRRAGVVPRHFHQLPARQNAAENDEDRLATPP